MFLPLTNNPEESFTTPIFGATYNFRQLWNVNGFWTIDIMDAQMVVLVYGVKIVTKHLLLEKYPQIRFDLFSDADSDPGRNDLESFLIEVSNKDV